MDFFARPSKRFGAWMNSLQKQGRLNGETHPIVTTNFNFPAPTAEGYSLITFNDALTLAHETGHALHGLLSDVTYESLGGTSVPRDFGEFGSQIMENWMGEPEVLRMYARHHLRGDRRHLRSGHRPAPARRDPVPGRHPAGHGAVPGLPGA